MRTITVPTTASEAVTHNGTNAAIAVLLGGYLAIVLYEGNLGALAAAAKDDFLGGSNGQPAFWRWAIALLILLALANSPRLNFLFGPLLAFTLVAMLINVATNQPQLLQNLNAGIASLFGRSTANG